MSSPKLGRNARLFKDGVVIGYAKDISVKASADLIKEYSMDSLSPAIVAPGKQTFTWSAAKIDSEITQYMMDHTIDTFEEVQSLGIETLRNLYTTANLTIRPKHKSTESTNSKKSYALGEKTPRKSYPETH
ncbi:MAG TPA: hypothetical protein VF893_01580 [Candidatus Bathyarchaeia archaeon]